MKIVVVVEGGVLQSVLSDGEHLDAVVCDYDTEGRTDKELVDVPDSGPALVMPFPVEKNTEAAAMFHRLAEGQPPDD